MRRFLWASLPLLGGCFLMEVSTPLLGTGTSEWYEVTPVSKPLPQVMEVAREALRRSGFTLSAADGTDRVFTEWMVHLGMGWREGFRTKLEVEVVKLETGGLKVRLRGIREINDSMRNASNPGDAKWISASLDDRQKERIPEYAIRVHQVLKLRLLEN